MAYVHQYVRPFSIHDIHGQLIAHSGISFYHREFFDIIIINVILKLKIITFIVPVGKFNKVLFVCLIEFQDRFSGDHIKIIRRIQFQNGFSCMRILISSRELDYIEYISSLTGIYRWEIIKSAYDKTVLRTFQEIESCYNALV